MRDIWNRLKENGSGWYWVVPRLRAGDVYHLCSFADAFKAAHGDAPIFLVVKTQHQASMAAAFDDHLAKIIVEPELSLASADWIRLLEDLHLPPFSIDAPLLPDPWVNATLAPNAVHMSQASSIPWPQLYKELLNIPVIAEPTAPRIRPERVQDAAALCEAAGMSQGRSVILFPYAQTYGVDAPEHFARLAEVLSADRKVFTSVAPGEAPIRGTTPVFIPFALLPDVAEYAGWAISVRSGISDILSSARCRNTVIHRTQDSLQTWSLLQLDLSRTASEFAFPFFAETPDAFVGAVLRSPMPQDAVFRPQGLADRVKGTHVSITDLETTAVPAGTLVVHDVPYRRHPRQSTAAAMQRLLEGAGGRRLYACRDSWQIDPLQASYPFWEEIDAGMLAAGRYYAAAYWHSLALADEPLEPALPLEKVTDGYVDLADPRALPAHGANSIMSRPLGYKGVVLMHGWYTGEGWGCWGHGPHSRIRLAFAAEPVDGFTLVLGANLVMSDRCPELTLRFEVNGVFVTEHRATLTSDRDIVIPVAPGLLQGRVVEVDVLFDKILSPIDQELSGDPRPLGLGLRFVKIEPPRH